MVEFVVKFKPFNSYYFSVQFPDVVEFSEILAEMGRTVIVAALDATYQRQVTYFTDWFIVYQMKKPSHRFVYRL